MLVNYLINNALCNCPIRQCVVRVRRSLVHLTDCLTVCLHLPRFYLIGLNVFLHITVCLLIKADHPGGTSQCAEELFAQLLTLNWLSLPVVKTNTSNDGNGDKWQTSVRTSADAAKTRTNGVVYRNEENITRAKMGIMI